MLMLSLIICLYDTYSLFQLRSNGPTGDLGAAAVRAVVEEEPTDIAHALVQQDALEIQLRQGFVRVTHVQVCFL